MLTEACGVRDVGFGGSWGELAVTSTPGKSDSFPECFPLVIKYSYWRIMVLEPLPNGQMVTITSLRLLKMSFLLGIVAAHTTVQDKESEKKSSNVF